ncbi:hypothetical protein [Nitratireductor thuwali]|uniref:Uncharacterized protein n=1 Tax=Nitratireductor thuwali TaxID=2267699 RepID=A0ABY5MKN2_9HYPH|nr:hypothetical protein NTH_02177 [Nitratireductor thuwali]
MSHYTIGAGSSAGLQRYAHQANRARSDVLRKGFLALMRAFSPQYLAKRSH